MRWPLCPKSRSHLQERPWWPWPGVAIRARGLPSSCLLHPACPQLFPAVPSGEPSYRSLLLVNKGLMLLTFNLAPSSSSSDIALRPTSGLVAPGAHQISLICAYPKGTSWKQHNFYLQLNSCLQYLRVGGGGGTPGPCQQLATPHQEVTLHGEDPLSLPPRWGPRRKGAEVPRRRLSGGKRRLSLQEIVRCLSLPAML